MTEAIGEQFVRALAAKDATALKALLRPDIDFKALTPGAFWEPPDADAIVDQTFFGKWFEPEDRITSVVEISTGSVGARDRVSYRLAVSNPDGDFLVEQQAYYETDGDQISWLRIMCAGYQPAS